jgi:tetratricopeptide (TPR) repeat protein
MNLNDISQEEFERIEAYLNKSLSKEDLAIFEERLKNEEGFSTKVEDIKTVLSGLEAQAMKEQLDVFHKDIETTSNRKQDTKVRSIGWKKFAIAAVFVIAAGSFWFLRGNANERLYSEYFSPDPGLPTTMSSTDNYKFYEAMVDYKFGNYKAAIPKWEALQAAKPNNDTLNYFLGVAHMANGNENKALPFLENAAKNSEFVFMNDAYYYLGLVHLKAGDTEKAKESFKKSSTEKSKEILTKLE